MSVIVRLCLRLHCFSFSVGFVLMQRCYICSFCMCVCGLGKAMVRYNPKMTKNLTNGRINIDK